MPTPRGKRKHGAFDFDGGDKASSTDLKALAACAEKLGSELSSKDPVLKALKQASKVLEDFPQEVAALGKVAKPLTQGLLRHMRTEKEDKEVKLCVTECLVKLLRIYAPESPFPSDDELLDVFRLMQWALGLLDKPEKPTFALSFSILQITHQVKLHLLLLDVDDGSLVPKMLETLLRSARDNNYSMLELPVTEICQGLLHCGEDDDPGDVGPPDQRALDALLQAMLGRGMPDGACSRLARRVMRSCADTLQTVLQQRLIHLLQDQSLPPGPIGKHGRAADEEGAFKPADVLRLVLELYKCVPQVLLPVLPHIRTEFESDIDSRRMAAVDLMVEMYCLPESDMAEQYVSLQDGLFRRFVDHVPTVRIHALNHTARLMASSSAPFKQQLLELAAERLADPSEAVRVAACRALCSAAAASLASVTLPALEAVGRRMRDKKAPVCRAAAEGLMEVFRCWAGGVAKRCFSDSLDPLAVWIPGRLAFCMLRSSDLFYAVNVALLKAGGMLPPGISSEAAAAIWVMVWDQAHPLERSALLRAVSDRAKLQGHLATYTQLQQQARSRSEAQNRDALARRAARHMGQLVEGCRWQSSSEKSKAQEQLGEKLAEVKDEKVFGGLATLADPAISEGPAAEARKDLLARLGSKSPLGDAASYLLASCLPLVLQPGHVVGLVELAFGLGQQKQQRDRAESARAAAPAGSAAAVALVALVEEPSGRRSGRVALSLLRELVGSAPLLLARFVPQLARKVVAQHSSSAAAAAGGSSPEGSSEAELQAALPLAVKLLAKCTLLWSEHSTAAAGKGKGAKSLSAKLPEQLPAALHEICLAGPRKAARWAPAAIIAFHQAAGADPAAAFASLAKEALRALRPSSVAEERTAAVIEAVCAVGRACPDAFAAHAIKLTAYVTETYLSADLSELSGQPEWEQPSPPDSLAASSSRQERARPGPAVAAKGAALKALARALTPDLRQDHQLSKQAAGAVGPLIEVLGDLLDIDRDTSELGMVAEQDRGHLRLSAAKALMRLSLQHESSIPTKVWTNLALMMQDPLIEVRSEVGAKIALHTKTLNCKSRAVLEQRANAGALAGSRAGAPPGLRAPGMQSCKYAAMLALAGIDPELSNYEQAARNLREFVVVRRQLALQLSSHLDSNNQSTQQPEYLMTYLIYLLAHHPDMPRLGEATQSEFDDQGPSAEELQAFSRMLQLPLEALLAPQPQAGSQNTVSASAGGSSLAMLLKLLEALKAVEDADTDFPCTDEIRGLCDMAASLARQVLKMANPKSDAHETAQASDHPGKFMLPTTLLVHRPSGDGLHGRQLAEGRQMPRGFKPELDMALWGLGTKRPCPPGLSGMDEEETGQDFVTSTRQLEKAAGKGSKRADGSHNPHASQPSKRQQRASRDEEAGLSDESMSEGESPRKATKRARGRGAGAPASSRPAKAQAIPSRRNPSRASKPTTMVGADESDEIIDDDDE